MAANRSFPSCSVIITTYNSPHLLEKVLWGFESQTYQDFEVVIADDGSTSETADCIEQFRSRSRFPLKHVWHEDRGFRKTAILNKAIHSCQTEYLIFVDGDCVPTQHFVQRHLAAATPRRFVSATAFRLGPETTAAVTQEDIQTQRVFSSRWMRAHGQPHSMRLYRRMLEGPCGAIMDRVTPTRLYWAGGNASAWKSDLIAVNGFDRRMRYGAEDKELGERLRNSGVHPICRRHTIRCVHLDHGRGYVDSEAYARNRIILNHVRNNNVTWTNFGLKETVTEQESNMESAA